MKNRLLRLLPFVPMLILVLCLTACGDSGKASAPETTVPPEYVYSAETLFTIESTRENAIAAQCAIITEGAQAFFEGQKSAEECARLIQSKVNIYVNEQK